VVPPILLRYRNKPRLTRPNTFLPNICIGLRPCRRALRGYFSSPCLFSCFVGTSELPFSTRASETNFPPLLLPPARDNDNSHKAPPTFLLPRPKVPFSLFFVFFPLQPRHVAGVGIDRMFFWMVLFRSPSSSFPFLRRASAPFPRGLQFWEEHFPFVFLLSHSAFVSFAFTTTFLSLAQERLLCGNTSSLHAISPEADFGVFLEILVRSLT